MNADDGGDKYDDEDDIILATDGPILTTAQDAAADLFIAEKAAELIKKHRHKFMNRAFFVRALAANVSLTTASASIKMCRPQKDIDYIIHVLKNWCVGVNIKVMDPCHERDSISKYTPTTMVPSMLSSMSLRRLLFLDPTCLAQFTEQCSWQDCWSGVSLH
jgi:hypothetical protein